MPDDAEMPAEVSEELRERFAGGHTARAAGTGKKPVSTDIRAVADKPAMNDEKTAKVHWE